MISVTPFGIVIFAISIHPEKALSPINNILLGKSIFLKLLQLLKTPSPITVKLSGKLISSNPMQSLNVPNFSSVTFPFIDIFFKLVHPINAKLPIEETFSGILMLTRF